MQLVDVHFSEKYYGEKISLFESIRIHVERTLNSFQSKYLNYSPHI